MVHCICYSFYGSMDQKTDFVAHSERFFVYTPLHPMSYSLLTLVSFLSFVHSSFVLAYLLRSLTVIGDGLVY